MSENRLLGAVVRMVQVPTTSPRGSIQLSHRPANAKSSSSSPDVLLRMLMMHVARGYPLRATVMCAKRAHWISVLDVAVFKRYAVAKRTAFVVYRDLVAAWGPS
jgi:hypothetical protein